VSYEIIWESRGVIKRFFGIVTNHDMVQSVIDTENDVRFDGYRYVINDFLDITELQVTQSDVDEVSVMDKKASAINVRIRIAVVTTSPDVVALAKHYATSPLNAYPTKIFSSLTDARRWIELGLARLK